MRWCVFDFTKTHTIHTVAISASFRWRCCWWYWCCCAILILLQTFHVLFICFVFLHQNSNGNPNKNTMHALALPISILRFTNFYRRHCIPAHTLTHTLTQTHLITLIIVADTFYHTTWIKLCWSQLDSKDYNGFYTGTFTLTYTSHSHYFNQFSLGNAFFPQFFFYQFCLMFIDDVLWK